MENIKKRGALFVVSTPLGNLMDITLRALHILSEVDLIASEDTRVTKRLLSSHGLSGKLISYREANRERAGPKILEALEKGKDVAIVTDAGTPGISDPGGHLIALCIDNGVDVVTIPGPSSIIAALTVSGLDIDRFVFLGFLPRKGKRRNDALSEIADETKTVVIFESPLRVEETIRDLYERIGDRRAALCRELTKVHEEVIRGSISDIIRCIEGRDRIRGEVVIIIGGAEQKKRAVDPDVLTGEVLRVMAECPDGRAKELAAIVSRRLGVPSSAAYNEVIKNRK